MGHKTHPLGFRLGITQQHHSQWYTKLHNYSNLIQEDFLIRNTINHNINQMLKELLEKNKKSEQKLEKNEIFKGPIFLGTIFIQRNKIIKKRKNPLQNEIKLDIYSPTPAQIIGKEGKGLNKLYECLNKNFPQQIILINLVKIKNPYNQASFIGDRVIEGLTKRIPFRRVIKKTIENVISENYEQIGIKIQVSGRLNGAEIARTEWRKEGRVPLHTLRAEIDYSSKTAATIYGSLGVKIWLFKGENNNNNMDLFLDDLD